MRTSPGIYLLPGTMRFGRHNLKRVWEVVEVGGARLLGRRHRLPLLG
jgi:hypothetical protein